jgi:hypothetical protein
LAVCNATSALLPLQAHIKIIEKNTAFRGTCEARWLKKFQGAFNRWASFQNPENRMRIQGQKSATSALNQNQYRKGRVALSLTIKARITFMTTAAPTDLPHRHMMVQTGKNGLQRRQAFVYTDADRNLTVVYAGANGQPGSAIRLDSSGRPVGTSFEVPFTVGEDGRLGPGTTRGGGALLNPASTLQHIQRVLQDPGFMNGETGQGFTAADRDRMLEGIRMQVNRPSGLVPG